MLRSLFGFDWRKSKAHLLLLSKFLHPKVFENFSDAEVWKSVLTENPMKAIKRFLDEGMLTQAGLNAQLDYKFKATELMGMLKQCGLPVSGRKSDLIQRLIKADPDGLKAAVSGLTVLQCSEYGRAVAEKYLADDKSQRRSIEDQVISYLKQRNFRAASIAVANFEAEQVFPRGMGIDWKQYNPAGDLAMLKFVFESKPKILGQLDNGQLNSLRVAAGMMYLWGSNECKNWLPPGFETSLAMDNDTAARMFLFRASHGSNLESYRQSRVVKSVIILSAQDSCEACRKISNKTYKLNQVLELPFEHCTHKMGCRCTLAPYFDE
jgi:hypothetical protein